MRGLRISQLWCNLLDIRGAICTCPIVARTDDWYCFAYIFIWKKKTLLRAFKLISRENHKPGDLVEHFNTARNGLFVIHDEEALNYENSFQVICWNVKNQKYITEPTYGKQMAPKMGLNFMNQDRRRFFSTTPSTLLIF